MFALGHPRDAKACASTAQPHADSTARPGVESPRPAACVPGSQRRKRRSHAQSITEGVRGCRGTRSRAVAVRVVLHIEKLHVGQEAYQLSGVAQTLDDYYSGNGEAAGLWRGGGAHRLGLNGDVSVADLRAVLAGLAPGSGGLTPNGTPLVARRNRVPGFDLTFKLPKSASVLYAVSDDPRVQAAIIDAGETAVAETLAWLEREAVRAQRGSHNIAWLDAKRAAGEIDVDRLGPRRITTSGVVAASFRHRTSRAGDPLLHWHVLVANLVEGADGRWSAFAHPDLYRASRAAGEIFQAAVRRELTQSLGVEWRAGRHVGEIVGVPDRIVGMFSKRRAEIDAWLTAHGRGHDTVSQQEASLATRRRKPEMEGERLDAGWKTEAAAAGWGPDAVEELVTSLTPTVVDGQTGLWRLEDVGFDEDGTVVPVERAVEPGVWIGEVLRRDLTQSSTTFTRLQVTQAVAARLSTGATTATVDRVVAAVLASDHVLTILDSAARGSHGEVRYTTSEIAAVEARFLSTLAQPAGTAPAPGRIVDTVLAGRALLGADQVAAVEALTSSGRAVSVLVGPAGTGKTYTLDAVREAFEHAGQTVIGAAPSARAAIELHAGAGIASRTLHALAVAYQRGDEYPTAGTVLVVDEAAMAGVRLLESITSRVVAAGGRVVLAGDHHQLPEIDAGGGFAAAAHRPDSVELTVNRRQRAGWEQAALRSLRDGDVASAVAAYHNHHRVIAVDDRTGMVDVAVDRWLDARTTGLSPVLLAGTNELVDRLNETVRARLIANGELPAEVDGFYGGVGFRVGERVVLRRNSTRAHTLDHQQVTVANGHTGTITALGDGRMTVRRDVDDLDITVDGRYLADGGYIDHAYAFTTTRAQGGTWDLSITVGLDGLYREAAYVDLSRGRHGNWLILTTTEAARLTDHEVERHDTGTIPYPDEQPDTLDELLDTVERSRAKSFATSLDPDHPTVEQLARTRPLDQLEARHNVCLDVERRAGEVLGADPDVLTAGVDRAGHTARHVAVGQTVKAWDRANIGTVTAIADVDGHATIVFHSNDGHVAERRMAWWDIEILTPNPPTRALSDPAQAWLDQLHEQADLTIGRYHNVLADAGVAVGEAVLVGRAVDVVIERATSRFLADPPAWLTQLLGERPADPGGHEQWTSTVREIAAHRTRQHLPDHLDGLGARPTNPADLARFDTLNDRIDDLHAWVARRDRPAVTWERHRSFDDLIVRRGQLDRLFADAPDDQRALIHRLQTGGRLDLDDHPTQLADAVATQHARREWILDNWPHLVEYDEIRSILTNRAWGPDTTTLLANLEPHATGPLAHDLQHDQPWITIAAAHLTPQNATTVSADTIDYLHQIADYRHHYHVTGDNPLGPTPISRERAARHDRLVDAIDAIDAIDQLDRPTVVEPAAVGRWDPDRYLSEQLRLEPTQPDPTVGIELD